LIINEITIFHMNVKIILISFQRHLYTNIYSIKASTKDETLDAYLRDCPDPCWYKYHANLCVDLLLNASLTLFITHGVRMDPISDFEIFE